TPQITSATITISSITPPPAVLISSASARVGLKIFYCGRTCTSASLSHFDRYSTGS
ncbi:hypothetical protein TorRG33x02_356750, partial [Trema orientale]